MRGELLRPEELLASVRAQPWAPRLLDALAGVPDLHLVGGAVRDLMLGLEHPDIDLVVEGDALAIAGGLAERLGGGLVLHERFGTAVVTDGELTFDLVRARAERYPAPGALPDVAPGTLESDLARRDFTVNAIALALSGERTGELRAVPHALADLEQGLIRVLHERSFVDDPTRLLRAVRYATRLGFEIEPGTAELARAAVSAGALDTVSGPRIRDELLDLLREPGAPASIAGLEALGIARALRPGFGSEPEVVERALALAPAEARVELIALAACTRRVPRPALRAWLERLGLEAGERDVVLAVALEAEPLAVALSAAERPSEIAAAVRGRPLEAVALAGALGAREPALRWLTELRYVALGIGGADLLAAGVAQGPAIGRALAAALAAKLDGELADGREAELRTALEAAR